MELASDLQAKKNTNGCGWWLRSRLSLSPLSAFLSMLELCEFMVYYPRHTDIHTSEIQVPFTPILPTCPCLNMIFPKNQGSQTTFHIRNQVFAAVDNMKNNQTSNNFPGGLTVTIVFLQDFETHQQEGKDWSWISFLTSIRSTLDLGCLRSKFFLLLTRLTLVFQNPPVIPFTGFGSLCIIGPPKFLGRGVKVGGSDNTHTDPHVRSMTGRLGSCETVLRKHPSIFQRVLFEP